MRLKSIFMAALCLAGFQTSRSFAKDGQMSPQAKLVADFMQASGNDVFVIMDKHNAELLVIERGKIVMETPALYGRGKGDDEKIDRTTTPAGIFSLREYTIDPKQYEGGRGFAFLIASVSYMIHPTWKGDPSERRVQRLASPDPRDNAISRVGCINVGLPFFERFSSYAKGKTTIRYDVSGLAIRSLPRLVVLPEDPDLEKTRAFFKIPANVAGTVAPNNP